MNIAEELAAILADDKFRKYIEKLYVDKELLPEENAFLLGCAVLLLQEYDKNNQRAFFEVAYDIVLRYSIFTGDYRPLYDVSCNYGFYPTVRFINKKRLLDKTSIINAINDFKLEHYKNEDYIETYEQHKTRTGVINSDKLNVCYIAPTSSGKSSVVIQHIKKNEWVKKSIIIVPTKSLIAQTYTELRKNDLGCKIISHEGMYKKEEQFIGVLTQERTLRLLEKYPDLSVDCIYIDEAHNIFKNDARNVLLSRVIKICRNRNNNLKAIYLSPFIENSNHLLQDELIEIDEQRICFNIKEPSIYEYKKDGSVVCFNRFSNAFFETGHNSENPFNYMFSRESKKNFCFLYSPRKIEKFAKELYRQSGEIEVTDEVRDLINVLSENVHPDFSMIKYLKHGIIFLHAKLPEQIKEYLEYQFKTNNSIKYMVANSVILEGINMPIDSLFVWDVYNMDNSRIQNLMGRVNRLNNVFDLKNDNLEGLLPKIHFINSEFYYNNRRKMSKIIEKLFLDIADYVTNPLLDLYDLEKVNPKERDKVANENREILEQEGIYFSKPNTEIAELKKRLISSGMNQLLYLTDDNVRKISESLGKIDPEKSVVEIVSEIFTKDNIPKDEAFSRLRNEKAINYYKHFISASHRGNLSTLVNSELQYQLRRKSSGEKLMYVGDTFGEVAAFYHEGIGKNVYIDISKKTIPELVNIIIVKIKIEQEFVGFQYNRAVNFLHDYGYISDDKYNMEIYGTKDEKKIQMLNMGISVGVLSLLENENQIKNIYFDEFGNICGNSELKSFAERQNSFMKFLISKHIYF